MACPTCSHTLAKLCEVDRNKYFHCERCGTIVVEHSNAWETVYVPRLVERCREFHRQAVAQKTDRTADVWRRVGIAESIQPPGERKEPA